jgi:D-alanyl-D-alanine carboxypeptidase
MPLRLPLACLLLALVITACGGEHQTPRPKQPGPRLTTDLARVLDLRLREGVADAGIPGASAAIVFPDGKLWRGAAGDAVVRPRRPMTTDTSLPFDSVTKVAASALALRLVEQGRLRLDDTVERWYPDWRGDARATISDLLGHTAGTRDPELHLDPRKRLTQARFLAAAPKPGPRTADARYSNVGYVILGRILERAAGEPLATAMRRQVLAHPGGDGLALQPAEQAHPPRAHSYWYPKGGGRPADISDGGPLLPYRSLAATASAAGAMAGDVPSLARWGHELFTGRVLRPASLRAMTSFHNGAFWEAYGLGLALNSFEDRVMWGHSGDGLGSHTEFWHLPRERLTLAVTWNDDLLDNEGGLHIPLLRAALTGE